MNISLDTKDDQLTYDTDLQSRKTVVKSRAGNRAYRSKPKHENSTREPSVAHLDIHNAPDPRQTRELDADDFFKLGTFTV